MLDYVKKDGTKVQINDQKENVAAAKALGWVEAGSVEKPKPVKKIK